MSGKENLIDMSKRSKDEVRAIAKKGGENSGKSRRAKKMLKELAEEMLSHNVKDKKILQQLAQIGFNIEDISIKEAMIGGQIISAMKGNTKAYEMIKETIEPRDSLIGKDIEDLTPLAKLLKEESDDTNAND